MAPYKLSIVNYLNAAPFVEGLRQADDLPMELLLDHPSESARRILEGRVDIALAPVAILPELPTSDIIGNYCIGAEGPVKTVKLFSGVPIKNITHIYLDYQSRTSVALVRILCRHHWKIRPEFIPAYPGFQKDIYGSHAGLIIGDRAIRALGKYPLEFDLGQEWMDFTGLPFVFAAWIARIPVEAQWLGAFDNALAAGLRQREEIARRYRHLNNDQFHVDTYLLRHIRYELDDAKRKGLAKFLKYLKEL